MTTASASYLTDMRSRVRQSRPPAPAPLTLAPPTDALDWAVAAYAALARGPTALVSILATEGSAPRGAGTRMIVTADALGGTIGGGRLEYQAIDQARAMLHQPAGAWRVQDYPLGPLLGQCCGGRVRLLVERLDPADTGWLTLVRPGATLIHLLRDDGIARHAGIAPPPNARGAKPEAGDRIGERFGPPPRPLLLFGAGHVGQAIAAKLAGLPLALDWCDTRRELAVLPGLTVATAEQAAARVLRAPAGAAILILTHDHALDYALTAAALRGAAEFVGLIGSATKRARFLARLERDGLAAAAATRLVCPIGLPGITGKAPEVIAIAVIAQLLAGGAA